MSGRNGDGGIFFPRFFLNRLVLVLLPIEAIIFML
jgi:hypothetical protein